MRIKTKIIIPVITLTLLVSAAIMISNIVLFSDFVDKTTADSVAAASKVAVNNLDFIKKEVTAASLSMAENREVIRAIVNDDRDDLMMYTGQLQDKAGIEFCTITDNNGTVLLCTHAPELSEDSVAAQANIRAAMSGESLTAIEEGTVIRLSVRAGTPVYDDSGTLVGVVSVGYRLDTEQFVDAIKKMSDCEATVFLGDERIATTVLREDGTRALGTRADSHISETVLAGTPYAGEADILGRTAVSKYIPIDGPSGRAIGMLFVGRYMEESAGTTQAFIRSGLIIALIMLAAFISVILIIVKRIVAPIHDMTGAASALAEGDTDIVVRVNTTDEMRTLASAFNSMIENARQQLQVIENIADGNPVGAVEVRSEKDLVNRALEKLNETIRTQAGAIREEHERIQLMLDATPLASRLWDRNFNMIECNEAAVKLFGLKNKREYMDRYFELSPEFQLNGRKTDEMVRMTVNEAFEQGSCTYEWMYRMPDGTPIPAENTLVRVPYGDDYAVAAYSRDLREQEKMMAESERHDRLLSTVNEAADILLRSEPGDFSNTLSHCMGMMAVAINADRMFLNKNFIKDGKMYHTRLHEWSDETLPAQEAAQSAAVSYDAGTPAISEALMRGEYVHGIVRDMASADRERLSMRGIRSVLLLPVFIRDKFWGVVGFGNCRDDRPFPENEASVMRSGSLLIANAWLRNEYTLSIAETSAKLETALEEAEQANRAKSDFLASISHEMRTPLNAIIGLSEIALDDGTNEDTKSNLEKIYNSGSTLLSIVNDLLDISKVQDGKFVIIENQYDVPSMVNDAVLQNVLRIGSRPIRFILDIDENIPACLYGDELRVKQIINNLLSNAIKYTDEGAVQLSISGLRDGEDVWLTVRVRDTGVGIRPEHLNRLFSDYAQFGTTSHQRAGGAGLGLAITKSLTETMGGGVTVESRYGEGSVFTVMLKQRYVNDTVIGPGVAESLKRFQYSTNKLDFNLRLNRIKLTYARVLVVDDNITNLDVARGFMKPYGMKTDCVTNGRDAIRAIRDEKVKYSAVFMDHMMPEMDGIEAARIIREEIGTEYAKTIPIIALTANAVSGSEEMFLKNGFQGFISKPIDPARLDEMLRRFVRDKERETLSEESQASTERQSATGRRGSDGRDGTGLLTFSRRLDGVDISRGIELYGDEYSFMRILRSYVINTKPLLESIKEVSEDTLGNYAITVHGLKGASRNIFAEVTGMSAEELEHAAKAGDFDFVARENPTFLESTRQLVENIETALDKIAKSNPKIKKERPDNDSLMMIYAACRDYDFNAVDAIMEEIERYEYTDDEGLADRLRESITQMNWTRVMEMLSFLSKGSEEQLWRT